MSNMQRYFQFLLFSFLMISVDITFFHAIGAADDVADYFEALRKPENKTAAKQAALKKKAEDARLNEVSRENNEFKKDVASFSEDSEEDKPEKPVAGLANPAPSNNQPSKTNAPSAVQIAPSKTGPTEVKLDDYREELRAPIAKPTPKKTR